MPGSESTDMAAETTQLYENDETFPPLIMIVTLPEDRTVRPPRFMGDEWRSRICVRRWSNNLWPHLPRD
jgi:hypothetical protein